MPSKSPDVRLRDIRDNILLAQSFVEGMGLRRFRSDIRTIYAVVRCLEIISEASRRLSTGLKNRHPDRHDYEEISAVMIWNTVKALPDLLEAVEEELSRLTRTLAKPKSDQ
jgi:uncharacterized protein with HEPN domain